MRCPELEIAGKCSKQSREGATHTLLKNGYPAKSSQEVPSVDLPGMSRGAFPSTCVSLTFPSFNDLSFFTLAGSSFAAIDSVLVAPRRPILPCYAPVPSNFTGATPRADCCGASSPRLFDLRASSDGNSLLFRFLFPIYCLTLVHRLSHVNATLAPRHPGKRMRGAPTPCSLTWPGATRRGATLPHMACWCHQAGGEVPPPGTVVDPLHLARGPAPSRLGKLGPYPTSPRHLLPACKVRVLVPYSNIETAAAAGPRTE